MTTNKINRIPAVQLRTIINRGWITHLTPFEFMVLTFIYERIYPYGKDAECIPYRHFIKGVYSSTGELLHAPVKMSRASIVRALSALRGKGVILTSGGGDGWDTVIYRINPVWAPVLLQNKGVALIERDAGSNGANAVAPIEPSITRDIELGKEQRIKTSGSEAAARLGAKLEGATEKGKTERQCRITKGGPWVWEKAWATAWRDYHPEWPKPAAWTGIDAKIFKKSVSRFPGLDVVAFIQWCIKEWVTVHSKVPGLRAYGVMPMLRPFVRNIEPIYNAYLTYTGEVSSPEGVVLDNPSEVIAKQAAEIAKLKTARPAPIAPAQRDPYAPAPRPYVPPGKQSLRVTSPGPSTAPTGNPHWDKPPPKRPPLLVRRIMK